MTKQVHIKIRNKEAILTNPEVRLLCWNNDYEVVFDFDEEWDNHNTKTAIFVFGNESAEIPFEGNVCSGAIIKNSVVCYIGVYSGDLITSKAAEVCCDLTAKDLLPNNIVEQNPDKYNALVEIINKQIKELQEKNKEQDEAIENIDIPSGKFVELNPKTEEQKIKGDIHILGRLLVDGEQTAVETESLFVKDRFIVCNVSEGIQYGSETSGLAMIIGSYGTNDYDGHHYYKAYGIVHDQETDTVRLGRGVLKVGTYEKDGEWKFVNPVFYFGTAEFGADSWMVIPEEGQAISTRANTIKDGNIPKWDDTQKTFVDSDASVRDLFNASYGLRYSLNKDDTYTVLGIGTCTDTDLIIPSQYNGKKVTRIEERAFEGNEHVTRVFIPKSISYVGYQAFWECFQIEKIYIEAENANKWETNWDLRYIEETHECPKYFYHKRVYKALSNFMDVTDSLGDVESALTTINESLDRIIEIQNSLIGGNG